MNGVQMWRVTRIIGLKMLFRDSTYYESSTSTKIDISNGGERRHQRRMIITRERLNEGQNAKLLTE